MTNNKMKFAEHGFTQQWDASNIKPNNVVKIQMGQDYNWLYIKSVRDISVKSNLNHLEAHEFIGTENIIATAFSMHILGRLIEEHYKNQSNSSDIRIVYVYTAHPMNLLRASFESREYYFNHKK